MDEKYPGKAQPVLVQKASGELQPFDSKKLELSLRNAGAKQETIQTILDDINPGCIMGSLPRKFTPGHSKCSEANEPLRLAL